ncbi:23S rRNA (cytidine(2498)-2'-O)-methyltransferase RlmM [Pistricoccus aurantiacus]|uniref:23S rRNA (cytidine(2498)-2'-O)-methyltransferase RlmM n=1 Tax=Pistricoccus aurantiacus TaxID=1883414 RepID=UPI00362E8C6C
MKPSQLLLYCRPGFERDLGVEIASRLVQTSYQGDVITEPGAGYVIFAVRNSESINALHRELSLDSLIFARQSLAALPLLTELPRDNRLESVIEQVVSSGWSFEDVWQETPDTNEGKALSGLTKALSRPLMANLKKCGALRRKAGRRRLHLFWTSGDSVQLGMSFPGNRSEHPAGILRLRSPRNAPSRSTLKLEEAWHVFIPREQWVSRLSQGMQAADLGAAPGGWTWQLVRQGMFVHAVDNGPMDKALMASGQVEHWRADGFSWQPPQRLDWLVCDIVDKPMRVVNMVERWLLKRWCREAIFNLKLPMKQRYEEVARCLTRLTESLEEARIRAEIQCRQLYHDREEVSVHVRLLDA